jgi:hypothetical protein
MNRPIREIIPLEEKRLFKKAAAGIAIGAMLTTPGMAKHSGEKYRVGTYDDANPWPMQDALSYGNALSKPWVPNRLKPLPLPWDAIDKLDNDMFPRDRENDGPTPPRGRRIGYDGKKQYKRKAWRKMIKGESKALSFKEFLSEAFRGRNQAKQRQAIKVGKQWFDPKTKFYSQMNKEYKISDGLTRVELANRSAMKYNNAYNKNSQEALMHLDRVKKLAGPHAQMLLDRHAKKKKK